MDQQGYLTVEFMFTLLVIIFMMTSTINIISERMQMVSETENLSEARHLAENVASAINKVNSGGNGHEITLKMPPNIGDSNYQLWLNSSGVYIESGGRRGKATIYPVRIWFNPSFGPGYRLLPNRTYRLLNRKVQGNTIIYVINVR